MGKYSCPSCPRVMIPFSAIVLCPLLSKRLVSLGACVRFHSCLACRATAKDNHRSRRPQQTVCQAAAGYSDNTFAFCPYLRVFLFTPNSTLATKTQHFLFIFNKNPCCLVGVVFLMQPGKTFSTDLSGTVCIPLKLIDTPPHRTLNMEPTRTKYSLLNYPLHYCINVIMLF